ncbi:hypothetical protein APA22_22770 [Acetobacter pasteurianus IFO 3283-22]|uniref:Uncharacterized protein n=3 Tax=Acetobacter pasteurianus TaxID=438 RepID=C7JF01_ACEP3|nr:hypothetical protein S101468_01829 [Acetobacter pasteurianus subsp. pasteurianus]BAI00391.1 hypothetical protein APA01_22770 [Acetobacter pasteurianus IFO 3283-01]BAI03442.1 hypothetical protein APA03_22770 [Acetobacter pasteurianus IFO 3283-03]BAI06487.1 hypothetical protein APA07_22770 [Acetobacter pasteurianus IFO 3283-07]BAI09537.1 hypothetical protein APA22_22770 [Acetobacter pasteurianus IFO 3283-22]BAI12585.1 hypothetical protein APA26_22770 [Acetobacter pasteurianus IFO 3283-26]BAI
MRMSYPSCGAMLTLPEMNQAAKRYEEVPCTWLWSDYTETGPNLLARLLRFLGGIDEYLQNSLHQPNMIEALRPFYIKEFNPIPSQAVIVGLAIVWLDICKLLDADSRYASLVDWERRPQDAVWRFVPIRGGLVRLHEALYRHRRTHEAYYWLLQIGWNELLELADKRDHAARELMAGRAFFEPEGGIAVLPADWVNHEAA